MRKLLKPAFVLLTVLLFMVQLLSLAGCTNVRPRPVPGVTLPPAAAPTPVLTVPVTDEPTPVLTEAPDKVRTPSAANTDALGNTIYTSDHFERYIAFKDILVYEEAILGPDGETEETLIDCKVVNSYPELLLCAVNITFVDENGTTIAVGSLQMPDGSFLLALESGETPLYARILTDTVLTDKNFRLSFDPVTGVHPQG